jgi:hypothetical protein
MFPGRFFPLRYYAARFWAKLGAEPPAPAPSSGGTGPPLLVGSVQRAIYDILSQDRVLRDMVTGVFDDVPEDQAFPYVQLGDRTETNKPSTMLTQGRENTLTLHIWSRAKGYLEAKQIGNRVIELLDDVPLYLPGWTWEHTGYEFGAYMRDMDGITRHGVLRFRVRARRNQ